jgi:collagenase-like PrtC family protease
LKLAKFDCLLFSMRIQYSLRSLNEVVAGNFKMERTMANKEFVGDPAHWAYQQGFAVGETEDTAQRGPMVFGRSCAKEDIDRQNANQWLAGFDAAVKAKAESKKAPVDPWSTKRLGRNGDRSDGQVGR